MFVYINGSRFFVQEFVYTTVVLANKPEIYGMLWDRYVEGKHLQEIAKKYGKPKRYIKSTTTRYYSIFRSSLIDLLIFVKNNREILENLIEKNGIIYRCTICGLRRRNFYTIAVHISYSHSEEVLKRLNIKNMSLPSNLGMKQIKPQVEL